ncbi:hypothetical protein NDA16_003653 [Ustilago loliicola]|nr:hypothetical protein NDA16_003653 [Ustilago loliicola]
MAASNPNAAAAATTGAMPSGLPASVESIAGAPGPNPQLQSQFPPGSGVLRLLQYSEALGSGVNRADIDYWRAFVNEFFIPTGVFRLILWNANSREQKGFEVPTYVLPRYLLTSYLSGLHSSQLQLENPREYQTGWPPVNPLPPPPASNKSINSHPSANVTHHVDVTKATYVSNFESGWQVHMSGLLRASFVPWATSMSGEPGKMDVQLRLESLDFTVHGHSGFIPRVAIQKSKVEHPLPNSLVANILSTGDSNSNTGPNAKKGPGRGAGARKAEFDDTKRDENGDAVVKTEEGAGSGDDDVKSQSGYTVAVEKTFLPEYPVNEYGISLRAMRCLEIIESVCQLRDLIDLSMRDKLGPIDSLRKFATQYREMQSGRPMSQTVSTDGNANSNAAPTPSQMPARPPSAQGGPPTENGTTSNHASPSVANGVSALKRKGKTAPSPSPKLGHTNNPAKRQR